METNVDIVAFGLAIGVVLINWGITKASVESLKTGQAEIREDIRTIYAALTVKKD